MSVTACVLPHLHGCYAGTAPTEYMKREAIQLSSSNWSFGRVPVKLLWNGGCFFPGSLSHVANGSFHFIGGKVWRVVMSVPGRLHTTFVGSHSSRALTLVSLTPQKLVFLSIAYLQAFVSFM